MAKISTERFVQGIEMACRLHATQRRKGTDIPYIAHLMAVAGLVLENGGDEDQAIAALLHDAVEDQGGEATRNAIRERFGERVAAIVDACTDTSEHPKPPWRERKRKYIAHLPNTPPDALLVSLADKVHNARAILTDLRVHGDVLWQRFRGSKDGTLWYYRRLATVFSDLSPGPLADELDRTVGKIEALASND